MTDPWHLNDDAFWSELDTATLQDEFRASEDAETLQHLRWAIRRTEAMEQFQAAVNQYIRELVSRELISLWIVGSAPDRAPLWSTSAVSWHGPIVPHPTRQERRTARLMSKHAPQPRTLHLALAHNARPVHRQSSGKPTRRTPASRRR